MQKIKHNAHLVIIIAILFVTGFSFANAFRAQGNPLVSIVSADDDEDDRDEEDDKEDEDDNDRDEDEDKDDEDKDEEDDKDDEDDEDEDKNEEQQKITRVRTSNKSTVRTQQVSKSDNEGDEEDEDEDEEKEDVDEAREDITELKKDIQKVDLKINILSINGIAVDAFKSNLDEVRSLVSQAESIIVSNPKSVEEILEVAEHKLERIEKLVKMSLKDDDEDEESTEEAVEEIGELKRDILKLENKLTLASERGLDVSAYKNILADAKAMLAQAEEKLRAGLYIEAEALAELADKKLDKIDDLFEDDEDEDGDDDIAKEYKNEVALFVHNLKEIGEIEGGIGQQVNVVAQAQNDAQVKVEESITDAGDRSGFVKFLIGPKYDSIEKIQTAIIENQTRIKVLSDLANQIADPAVKQVLQDQVAILTQQNSNLQKFITENESGVSLFGWLVKIFS